jgi:hypothetical protein
LGTSLSVNHYAEKRFSKTSFLFRYVFIFEKVQIISGDCFGSKEKEEKEEVRPSR